MDNPRQAARFHWRESRSDEIGWGEYSVVPDRRDLLRLSGFVSVLRFNIGKKRCAGKLINVFFLRAALRPAVGRAMSGHGRASSGAAASACGEGWREGRGNDIAERTLKVPHPKFKDPERVKL